MVETHNDITFVVKFLIVEKAFEKILGRTSGDNAESTNMDLFRKAMVALAGSISLRNDICQA